MTDNVPYRRSIPSGGPPQPFDTSITSGNVQAFSRKVSLADMSMAQNNYHYPGSEWMTTEKVQLAAWEDSLDYERHISPGDLVFLSASRERPVNAFDSKEMYAANVQCVQDLLKRLYNMSVSRIAPFVGKPAAVRDAADGDADRLPEYEKYLKLPETCMLELFSPNSEFLSKTDAAWSMRFLSLHGITDTLRPFGVVTTDPSIVYDASRGVRQPNPLRPGRKLVSVCTSGVVDMYNYWPGAQQLDHLFMVITRHYSPEKNGYEQFYLKFPHRSVKELAPHGQMYYGINDLPERAAVYYVGQLVDLKAEGPPVSMAPIIQGVSASISESIHAMRNAPKIRVLLAPLVRRT